MSLHKQLVMDTACGVEEGRGAGLGTPSALLYADHCSLGQAHLPAEALMACEEGHRGQRPSPAFIPVSRLTPRPPAAS